MRRWAEGNRYAISAGACREGYLRLGRADQVSITQFDNHFIGHRVKLVVEVNNSVSVHAGYEKSDDVIQQSNFISRRGPAKGHGIQWERQENNPARAIHTNFGKTHAAWFPGRGFEKDRRRVCARGECV